MSEHSKPVPLKTQFTPTEWQEYSQQIIASGGTIVQYGCGGMMDHGAGDVPYETACQQDHDKASSQGLIVSVLHEFAPRCFETTIYRVCNPPNPNHLTILNR